MPNFFIDRPNFAWVVAIFICLAGLISIRSLGVSQYPDVAPPQIEISVAYPGASAQVLDESVVSLIEQELNGAKNLLYYETTSDGIGAATTTVTFRPDTNPDLAQVDVQNRMKRVEARLPAAVLQQGLNVEQANTGFLLIYALTNDNREGDTVALADYAARNINNEIRRVQGVGKVRMFSSERAMRVWVDPAKLMGLGLSVDDVYRAIEAQNAQVPAGRTGSQPLLPDQKLTFPILVKGQLTTPDEFGEIVLRALPNGATVRVADVARVEVGRQNYDFNTRLNGSPAVAIAVQLQPGANALETAALVKAKLADLSGAFPKGMQFSVPYDTSRFVKVAIQKVVYTLLEAIVLVFLVMFLFLQNLRYTLIPTIVVPVCLLGTFAAMSLFGFTINMMTMFGMVLAIGILVDDAIIVVENVERIMAEEGLSPKEATRKAMSQISSALVGITLTLSAVFLPLAFMSGSVGVIYRQFSMSLAVSIMLSGFLALTMTPALCATLLKPIPSGHADKKGFFAWFNRGFQRSSVRYEAISVRLVRKPGRYMLIYLAIVGVLLFAYLRLPSAFLPEEDQGYLVVSIQLPPGATALRTQQAVDVAEEHFAKRSGVESVLTVLGFSFSGEGQSSAMIFPTLKDWSRRDKSESAAAETVSANQALRRIDDGTALSVMPPAISGMGSTGGFSLRLQDRAGLGHRVLSQAKDQLLAAAAAAPEIAYAIRQGLDDEAELRLDIDRVRAEALGVGFAAIKSTLALAFGSAQVNEFSNQGRMQKVVVQAEAAARMTPESLKKLYVPNRLGEQVPLAAFADIRWTKGAAQLTRYNGYPAFEIAGDAAPGYSSGQAMAAMERIAKGLPPGIDYEWSGLSYEERAAGAQGPMLLAFSLLVVFLLLVALYESWAIPLSVMLIVPIGALGAVLAVTALSMPNDVYFKVGLVTIIGLAAKNAILIIEFAKTRVAQGQSVREAATEAARLRFRPILMTSMAFVLGVVPLAFAHGAGAASQHSIGVGVIGGMLGATVLGTFFIPVFFVWVMSFVERYKALPNAKSALKEH